MPPELGIPEGLRDVIGKRLSRLSVECNQLLAVAAVIGRDFDLALLQQVTSAPEEAVLTSLEEAVRAAVVEERSDVGGAVRLRFTHAFFRQTLYEEIFAPRRIRLHQQVARAMEAVYARRLSEHATELAEHFAQSSLPDDLRKALEYSRIAAERALSVYAYGEAVRYLEQAIKVQDVLDPDDQAACCDLYLALGEALLPAGEPRRAAEEVAPKALAQAEALADRPRASRACQIAREGLTRYGGAAIERTPEFGRWAELADRYAAPGSVDRVYADLALATYKAATRAPHGEIRLLQRRAWELVRQLDDPEALYASAWQTVLRLGWVHEADEGLRLTEEVATRSRERISSRTLGQFLWYGGLNYLSWGERDRFEAMGRELEELGARTRDPGLLWRPMLRDCFLATLDGDLEGALEAAARLAERAEELGVTLIARGQATLLCSWAAIHLGRSEEDLAAVTQSTRAADNPFVHLRFLLHSGRREEARSLLSRLLEQRQIGSDDGDVPVGELVVLLETATLLEDRPATGRLASLLAAASGRIGCQGGGNQAVTCNARHLGAASALLGEREQAMTYYQQALEVCAKIRFRPEIALTHLQMAELMLEEANSSQQSAVSAPGSVGARHASPLQSREAERSQALEHLDLAIAEFRAMEMQPALERALRHKDLLKA